MRTLLILSKWAVGIFLGVILVALVGLMGLTQLAEHLGYSVFVIDGGSMTPTIARGALVIDQTLDPSQIRPGDVITARAASGAVYTHRVMAVETGSDGITFQTQGDANGTSDPGMLPSASVIGRVSLAVPFAGLLVMFIGLPSGMPTLITLVFALTIELWVLGDIEDDWFGLPQAPAESSDDTVTETDPVLAGAAAAVAES
jgi:signal peptidase I